MPIEIAFRTTLDSRWWNVAPLRFGGVPQHLPTADRFVTAEHEDGPLVRVDLYQSREENHAFEEAIAWRNLLAIGWGHHAYFVDLASREANDVELDSYFGRFYPTDDLLLIASAEQVFAVDASGKLVWRNKLVGYDGVVIDGIENEEIRGHGEWDPPDGWEPFRLNLRTGTKIS